MSNKFCPNLNLPESKALIKKLGLIGFYKEYIKNNYQVPNIDLSSYIVTELETPSDIFSKLLNFKAGYGKSSLVVKKLKKFVDKNSNLYHTLSLLEKIDVEVHIEPKFTGNQANAYAYIYTGREHNVMFISEEQVNKHSVEDFISTFMHELVHGYTVQAYNTNKNFKNKIDNLFKEGFTLSNNHDLYGWKNPKEFITELYTNPDFQTHVKSLETVWERFLNFVRDLFGTPSVRSRGEEIFNESFLLITDLIEKTNTAIKQNRLLEFRANLNTLNIEDFSDVNASEIRSVEDIIFVNKELFDAHQQDTIIDSFVYQIYTKNQQGIKNIKDTIRDEFERTGDDLLNNPKYDNYSEVNEIRAGGQAYTDILSNFDDFYNRALQRLEDKGAKRTPNLDSENEEGYGLEDTEYDYEGATYAKLNYSDESAFVQSSKDTASSHIKLALSFIPKYEIENGKIVREDIDGKLEPVVARNYLGLEQFEDMDSIWNDLLYTLIDEPIGKKLDYLKNSGNPKHQAVYYNIVNTPNTQIQNEFESTFSKQQAKFITVLVSRPDGNGFKTISVLDTNRNNADNLIIDDWYTNLLESSVVKTDSNGNRYIDTEIGKQLKQEYTEAIKLLRDNPARALTRLQEVLSKAGIQMSDVALASEGLEIGNKITTVDDILRNQVKFIFDRLAGDINEGGVNTEDTLENNNPYINENRPLELLAKLENQANPSVFEGSFISGDGKAKYSFVNNTYLSHRFRDLTTNQAFVKQLKSNPYSSGSYYLEQLTGPNRENFLHNFSMHYVDSLGNDATNQTNKPFRRMNTQEKEFFRVSLFQNGNNNTAYFIGLTPSDKTTLPMFKVPKINVGNFAKSGTVNSNTKRILLNQFTSEYDRVKRTIEQNNDPNISKIAGYHGNTGMGSRFIVFPWANDLLFQDGNLKELGTTEMAQVWAEMDKFILDIVNEQLDYWNQLGINQDNIFDKSYRAKQGDSLTDLAAQYAINNFIFLHNQTQIISGDPALHGKSVLQDKEKGIIEPKKSIDKTWNNYYKRLAKDIAPGLDGNFGDKTTFKTVFLKDLEYTSNHLNEYLEKVGGHLSKAYGEINPADAQEYTTLDEHLNVMRAYGRITREQEDAVERLKKGSADPNDISLILQPMKPVYVGTKFEDGIEKYYYIKTSSFPLIPALTRGLEIDKLRRAMEDPVTGADRAVYESGVKLGLQGDITNVSNNGGTTFNNISFNERQIISLDRSGFRIQQELPYHGLHGSTNEGSQGRKLVLSNIDNGAVYKFNNKEYTGSELKDIYEQLHIEKMDRAWNDLIKDIGYNPDTRRIENLSRLAEILKEEATSRDYPVNDIYSIQLIEENGKYRFKVPLGFTNNSSRFESILNSLVTNRVIKSELPGFTLVQAASSGFTKQPQFISDERIQDYTGLITWVNPKETELNYIREENGTLVSADILVPNYFKGINLKDYVVGGYLDLNRIPEDLLTIIGLRIPTQGKNSMMKFRVKGFLPDYMGELAVVPAEITAQMGSDFDVDKLFLYRYNYKTLKDGSLKKITKELSSTGVDIDYSKLSTEQIDNLIIQMFEDILSDTRFYDEIVEPNGFGLLPKAANIVAALDKSSKNKSEFTSRAQNTMYEVNADGKMGTAIFSLFSTFYRTAQDVDLGIRVPLKFKNSNGQVIEVNSLGSQNTIEGGKKSNTIMYLQSAAVDNAKEQVLGKLNINEYTMNEAGVMAMLGLPEDFIGYFMSQPAIKEYVARVSQNGSILGGEFESNIIIKTIIELLELYSKQAGREPGTIREEVPLSSSILLDNISNTDPLIQIQVLSDFEKILEISGAVRALQSATNVDTKGVGANLIAVENKYNQFQQLSKSFLTESYPLINADKIFINTSAGRAKGILEDTRNMYSQILPYGSPTYSNTINSILELGGLVANETNLKNITSDLKSYILSSREFIGNDVKFVRDSLLFGKDNIAKRWSDYIKTDEGKNNPLSKRIKPKLASKKGQVNGLRALNTPASNNKIDIDNSITYFYNMLNSDNTTERELAEDLVKYHLLTGAQYGPNSIGKYITYDVLERYNFSKKLRDIDDNLYSSDVDFTGFLDQFFVNNPFKAHSVNFNLEGDKVEIKRLGTGILTSGGTAAGYIVKYDSNKRVPLLYKLIGIGSEDSFVYGKLPVNEQYKQVKRYNFEQGPLLNSDFVKPKEDNPVIRQEPAGIVTPIDRAEVLEDNYNLVNESGIDEVLNRILERTNSDYKKSLANDLLENLDFISNVNIEISSDNPNANGWYNSNNNTIYINTAKISQFADMNGKLEEVILHEMLHAATANLLAAEQEQLSPKQVTARNKINRLFTEYSKTVDQNILARYRELYNKTNRTQEELDFLQNNKATYYPLLNVDEFVAAGLTSESFRNTLKSNNLWTRFLDLISNLLGVNSNDLEVLYTSTIDLISDTQTDTSSNTFEDFSELNDDELARQQFVAQRDELFRKYKVNNYWNNIGKKYTADSQNRFLEANTKDKYDRLKVWFWNNELRVSHVDPKTKIQGTHFDVSDLPETQEDKLIDRMIKTYQGRLTVLERRRRSLGDAVDVRLDRDIERTRDKLNKLKGERSIINIYETSKIKMDEIEEGLNSENINQSDLEDYNIYLTEFLKINSRVDFDTTDEEGIGLNYRNKFNELAGRASELKQIYREKSIDLIGSYINKELNLTPEVSQISSLNEGVRDVGVSESQTLSYAFSSSQHVQNVGYLIKKAEYDITNSYNNKAEEVGRLFTEYRNKYGNNFDQLFQTDDSGKKTSYLINKYKDSYYKKAKGNKKFVRSNSTAILSEESKALFETHRKQAKELYENDLESYNQWLAYNDPNIWVENFNSGKKVDWTSGARRYIKTVPSDNWIDSKYNALKNKDENDPAVKLYNYIEPILRQANKKYNQQINYIPEISMSSRELFMKGKIKGGVSKLWKEWGMGLNDDLVDTRSEDDKIRDIDINNLTNEPRLYIPKKMFNNKLKADEKSNDLSKIITAVIYQEESIRVKHTVEPLLNVYYALLKDSQSIIKVKGTEVTVDKPPVSIIEQSSFMINSFLYNQRRAQNTTEEAVGEITDNIISLVRIKNLGWNPFSMIGNLTQSFSSNTIFAAGGQYFNEKEYLKSLSLNLNQIAGNRSIAKKIQKAFEFTNALSISHELSQGKDKRISSPKGLFNSSWFAPMFGTQIVEYFNQGQTMVGVLLNKKVKNLAGETKSLWDAYDDNFKWKTEEFGEELYKVGSVEHFKLQSLIEKAIEDVHGNYSRDIQIKKHFWGRAMMVFRTWLPQAIYNRFGGYRKDEFLGTETKGRYKSYGAFIKNKDNKFDFGAMRENLLWLLKLSKNTELSNIDKVNMRKNLVELLMIGAMMGLIALVKSLADDDDEELTTYVLNSMIRAQSDLTMFLSYNSWNTVIKDPIPITSIAGDVIDWSEAVVETVTGNGIYKSGYRKGKSKLFMETLDQFPGIRQVPKQWAVGQQLFGEYNR